MLRCDVAGKDVASNNGRGDVPAPIARANEGHSALVPPQPVSGHTEGAEIDEDDEHV